MTLIYRIKPITFIPYGSDIRLFTPEEIQNIIDCINAGTLENLAAPFWGFECIEELCWKSIAMENKVMDASQERKIGRRDFMKATIAAIGGIIGAALGLPAIPYIMGPALKKDEENWIQLGTITKVELDNPTLFKTTIETQTGWINAEEEFSVYVLTENGQDFVAMSNICTHLGCRIRWIPDQEGFFCPCHNGVFAKDGTVIAGPPPRPLDRFETKVEEGILFVKRG